MYDVENVPPFWRMRLASRDGLVLHVPVYV